MTDRFKRSVWLLGESEGISGSLFCLLEKIVIKKPPRLLALLKQMAPLY